MSFFSVKKMFCFNKNKKKKPVDGPERSQIKHLEVFRSVPGQVVGHIEDIKATVTGVLLDRTPSDYQRLQTKLNSLVKHLEQNELLREYANLVYSRDQNKKYRSIVRELTLACDELSAQINLMLFFNNRDLRVAEMVIEITDSSKQLQEKKKQVCMDVELLLKQRMAHKWFKLKTSTDREVLEKFLAEIVGQKKAILSRQEQGTKILAAVRVRCGGEAAKCDDRGAQRTTDDDTTTVDVHHCGGGGGDDDDDICFDGSFGSTAVAGTL